MCSTLDPPAILPSTIESVPVRSLHIIQPPTTHQCLEPFCTSSGKLKRTVHLTGQLRCMLVFVHKTNGLFMDDCDYYLTLTTFQPRNTDFHKTNHVTLTTSKPRKTDFLRDTTTNIHQNIVSLPLDAAPETVVEKLSSLALTGVRATLPHYLQHRRSSPNPFLVQALTFAACPNQPSF